MKMYCTPARPGLTPIWIGHPSCIHVRRCAVRAWAVASDHDSTELYDVAVIGGGAAGLTAAYFAAEAGASVVVMEKNREPGRKITISGGTRCNVLPQAFDTSTDYFTESSHSALRAVFSQWSLSECTKWLSDKTGIGISLKLEEETGKFFPVSNSAVEVRDKLVEACIRKNVRIMKESAITDLVESTSAQQNDYGENVWMCHIASKKDPVRAKRVILATGGLSFPKLGGSGIGYTLLRRLGHRIIPPYPALVPLLGKHPGGEQLPGISVQNASAKIFNNARDGKYLKGYKKTRSKGRTAERRALLLTHRGYSGPAILDISHDIVLALERGQSSQPRPELQVNWMRDFESEDWEQILSRRDPGASQSGRTGVASLLKGRGLPARLVDALCAEAQLPPGRNLSELRKEERTRLISLLTNCTLDITGHEGYGKAEVTGGGIPLEELDCKTMESRLHKGLHICGELCDVHGRIGGFNFWWAWVSGRSAGLAAGCLTNKIV
jgi:predicted Rossmann fold flavoprotein